MPIRTMPRTLLHPATLCLLVGLTSCTVVQRRAEREAQRSEVAEGLARVSCSSHNGSIVVRGLAGKSTVDVTARLVANARSERDARDLVEQMDVEIVREGNELRVRGVVPSSMPWGANASLSFTIEAPAELALQLVTHNGAVDATGSTGDVSVVTHNGAVRVHGGSSALEITTHNGGIDVVCEGSGAVRGSATTHNGSVDVDVGSRSACVEASTSNGRIDTNGLRVESRGRHSLRAVAGDGQGGLRVGTHNGSVCVRSSGS